ncbi:unnamed protein product [Cylicocyclus nassatus]|uniref:Uncharacterized protein n=1 Tax=Cylicocyclus nassatus TaxID=53992 RepID=A0AA36DRF6_CYLNA|nr:unnamed protein product [Cylicocyclus nassatus]
MNNGLRDKLLEPLLCIQKTALDAVQLAPTTMLFDVAVVLILLITLVSLLLYCCVIAIMWRNRKSSRYKTFFFKTLWNESFINSFTIIFFLTTMYIRCYGATSSVFLFLNRYSWWTKFAQITQEQIMYTQTMNVFLTVGGRFCTVCLPHSQITYVS